MSPGSTDQSNDNFLHLQDSFIVKRVFGPAEDRDTRGCKVVAVQMKFPLISFLQRADQVSRTSIDIERQEQQSTRSHHNSTSTSSNNNPTPDRESIQNVIAMFTRDVVGVYRSRGEEGSVRMST